MEIFNFLAKNPKLQPYFVNENSSWLTSITSNTFYNFESEINGFNLSNTLYLY